MIICITVLLIISALLFQNHYYFVNIQERQYIYRS